MLMLLGTKPRCFLEFPLLTTWICPAGSLCCPVEVLDSQWCNGENPISSQSRQMSLASKRFFCQTFTCCWLGNPRECPVPGWLPGREDKGEPQHRQCWEGCPEISDAAEDQNMEPLLHLPALAKSSAEWGQPWGFPVWVISPSSHSPHFCFAVVAELEPCAREAVSGK